MIGMAKSRLYGKHDEVEMGRGDQAELMCRNGNNIGAVVRISAFPEWMRVNLVCSNACWSAMGFTSLYCSFLK
jgi:hypothetical protein